MLSPRGPSLVERLLGGAVLLLLAALALRWAVELLLSIIWPLVALVVLAVVGLVVWRLWRGSRDVW